MNHTFPTSVSLVLDHLSLSEDHLIGKGGEGFLFALDEERVVKIYPQVSREYLEELRRLQQRIQAAGLPFKTPFITSIQAYANTFYTIEAKLPGAPLEVVLPTLSESQQFTVLDTFFETIEAFTTVPVQTLTYGQIVNFHGSIQADSWRSFLHETLTQRLSKSAERLLQDVEHYSDKVHLLTEAIEQIVDDLVPKSLVHADYYLNNVLVTKDLKIGAVLDFSSHTAVGDHRLDLASLHFLTLSRDITATHINYVRDALLDRYGKELQVFLDIYGMYYAFYFSNAPVFDDNTYAWCLNILNDESHWKRLQRMI